MFLSLRNKHFLYIFDVASFLILNNYLANAYSEHTLRSYGTFVGYTVMVSHDWHKFYFGYIVLMRKLIMIRCQHVISFIYYFTLLIREYNKTLEIGKNYCDKKFNLIYKLRII